MISYPQDFNLDDAIRKVPDFPKPGILFYDITSIFTRPEAFLFCIEKMKDLYKKSKIDGIAGIEARGFLFAAPLARELEIPLILIRKKGKLPGKTLNKKFDLEYGQDEIQVHREDIKLNSKILIVDDLIATGGTLEAAAALIEEAGAQVAGFFGVVGLPFLNYHKKIGKYPINTLIDYQGE
jgi:adenine phosphoribosyltransferase